jgi:hypothetical protein
MPYVSCPACARPVSAAQILRTNRCVRCGAVAVALLEDATGEVSDPAPPAPRPDTPGA